MSNRRSFNFSVRVLIYKEGKRFVAHALEADLLAYGENESEARRELEKTLDNQIDFAFRLHKPEMIYFPAPKRFFEQWEKAQAEQLRGAVKPNARQADRLHGKATFFALERMQSTRHAVNFPGVENLAVA